MTTLKDALDLMGESAPGTRITVRSNGKELPVLAEDAVEILGGCLVEHVAYDPETKTHVYALVKPDPVPSADPVIAVCVLGGIVSNVYTKGIPGDVSVLVLDVDKERDDAAMIEDYWDEIAAPGSGYEDRGAAFYAPREDDGPDPED